MKFTLILSMFFIYFICLSCFSIRDKSFKEQYNFQMNGYYVISNECPEFKRLIKEGRMWTYRYCEKDYCDIYLDEKLFKFFKENYEVFHTNKCIKTKSELDILFGHDLQTYDLKPYKVILLPVWTRKAKKGQLSYSIKYILNEQDSIINNVSIMQK